MTTMTGEITCHRRFYHFGQSHLGLNKRQLSRRNMPNMSNKKTMRHQLTFFIINGIFIYI
jgi:hypothetical protein